MSLPFSLSAAFTLALSLTASLAVAQTTVLVVHSEPGDPIGKGLSRVVTNPALPFGPPRTNNRQGVEMAIDDPAMEGDWRLAFAAPAGTPLSVGYYPGAHAFPFSRLTAMSLSNVLVCSSVSGRFLVRELVWGTNGTVLRLAIDAEQHCNDAVPGTFIAVRYNSLVPTDVAPAMAGRFGIRITPPVNGIVTGDGVACGNGLTACDVVFSSAATATLTAVPNSGYTFMGWTGGCTGGAAATVNINMVRECGAVFETALPSAPRTRLTLSIPRDTRFTRGGGDEVHSPVNSLWRVEPWHGGFISWVDVAEKVTNTQRMIMIMPPANMVLGQWFESRRFNDNGFAGVDVSADYGGCNTAYGRLRVHEWAVVNDRLAFAADFEHRCDSPTAPLTTGTLHFQATFEIPPCPTADPFAAIGGGTCSNGGWLPPGMNPPSTSPSPTTPPPSTPPPTIGCTTPDPFAGIGGGVCYGGGWLPPGMTLPGGGTSTPPPPTTPPPSTPPPSTPPPTGGCATPDPFAGMGGGSCVNGGWLPPGMAPPSGTPTPPPPPSTPPASTGTCTTPDPFANMGGGTCYAGGWLPPGMPIPGGGGGV